MEATIKKVDNGFEVTVGEKVDVFENLTDALACVGAVFAGDSGTGTGAGEDAASDAANS